MDGDEEHSQVKNELILLKSVYIAYLKNIYETLSLQEAVNANIV